MNNQTYIIIDLANIFFRNRHVARGEVDDLIGICIQGTLAGIRKAWREFKGTHVVIALEGRSWRKDYYAPYKRNRSDARAKHTVKEQEEDKLFWETFEKFKEFATEKTNCTVLQHQQLEADDLIAGWIQTHPDDNHVIVSTDGDFAQLIAANVRQYNGVSGVTTTVDGYFNDKNKPVIDKKTKAIKEPPNPEWLLFEKTMRGDVSDNIFSAYPGVRTKGSKNKVGLLEAFEDRKTKGWAFNNVMLQKWNDHEGVEHRVLDDYNRNVVLCDLSAQPDHIKTLINQSISDAKSLDKNVLQVGIRLLKFCALYDLPRVSDQVQSYAEPLNARYIRNENT